MIGSNQGKVLPACDGDAHREESVSRSGSHVGRGLGIAHSVSRNLDTSVRPPGRIGVLGCTPPRQASGHSAAHLTPREQHMRPEAEDLPSGAHTPGLLEQRHESGLFKWLSFRQYCYAAKSNWLSSFIPKD